MALQETLFDSVDALNDAFAAKITALLQSGIDADGRASLVVSGGRTPLALFKQLSETDLNWSKVDITLADERWVEPSDDASNEKMVRANLLVGKAAEANFVGLKNASKDAVDGVAECTEKLKTIKTPFDVLILGMGEDGHTASLFPCSTQIKEGLDLQSGNDYLAVQPTTAPNQRMSLTLPALLQSKNTFLHLTGAAKKDVLGKALSSDDAFEMPIRAVFNNTDVELVWAP